MMNREFPTKSFPGRHAAAGVGLIEVLVAIAILAFGMLGIAALQAAALRSSQSSINRNEAIAQSYAILDAMRANRDNALLGKYDMGTYDPDDESSTSWTCAVPDNDGVTLASADRNEWMTRLRSPQGLGDSACAIIEPVAGVENTFEVRIRWDDSRGAVGAEKESDDNDQTIVTTSRL
jgi:type IV pilus assembly protein PilV